MNEKSGSCLTAINKTFTFKPPETRSLSKKFDMPGRSINPATCAKNKTASLSKEFDKDKATRIICRTLRRFTGKRSYQRMFDNSIDIKWENNSESDALNAMQEISRGNVTNLFRLLTPLKDYEKDFLHVFLNTKFFVTHATDAEITDKTGNITLYSSKKLKNNKIAFIPDCKTYSDELKLANDDFIFFSLESGDELQKKASRFGKTIYRFELNSVLKTPAWMSLTEALHLTTPTTVKKHIPFISEEGGIFLHEKNKVKECSFFQKDILPGLALSIINKSRILPESEQRSLLSLSEPTEINKIVNSLFRPEVKVPVHYFSSSFTQETSVKDKALDYMKVSDIGYMTRLLEETDGHNRYFVRHAAKIIRNNKKFMKLAISKDGLSLQDASEALKADPYFVRPAVENNGNALQFASELVKDNPDIVLAAVKQNGNALEFASERLKNNPEIVLAAVKQNGNALQFASDELKNNPKIVLAAVKQNGNALQFASDELKNNPEIVLAAVKQNGNALQFASDEIKNNPNIALAAVKSNGIAQRYVSEGLMEDSDYFIATIQVLQVEYFGVQYLSEALRSNQDFMLPFILKCPILLGCVSDRLKSDRDFLRLLIQHGVNVLEFASESLKSDREFVLEAVQTDRQALQFASEALKGDREIVMAAIRHNSAAFEYASEALKTDLDFILEVLAVAEEPIKILPFVNNTVKRELSPELLSIIKKSLQRQRGLGQS